MTFSVLMIAVIFFLVTMALAVGPLLACRLFAGSSDPSCSERCEQPAHKSSATAGVLTVCGFAIAVVFPVFAVNFAGLGTHVAAPVVPPDTQATNEHGPVQPHAMTMDMESSLFDRQAAPPPPLSSGRPATWKVPFLTSLLLVWVCTAMVFAGLRYGLLRLLPAVIVGGLVVILFMRFSVSQDHRRAMIEEREQLKSAALVMESQQRSNQWEVDPVFDSQRKKSSKDAPVERPADGPPVTAAAAIEPPSDDTQAVSAATSEDRAATPAVIEFDSTDAVGVPRDALPDWTQTANVDGTRVVIRSGPHATVELAEQQALDELKSQLKSEFIQRHEEALGWLPPDEVVLNSGSILRRAVERTQITVGEFTSPMYETYWQVDTAIGAGPLEQAWRPTVVYQRLGWLGGGVGVLTLLLGSLAAGLRIDEQTGGSRRKALALGTFAMWVLVGGALLVA